MATFHQQHQQLQQLRHGTCPEHPNGKGVDCKTCELLECSFYGIGTESIRLPRTPSKSPNGNGCNVTTPPVNNQFIHYIVLPNYVFK